MHFANLAGHLGNDPEVKYTSSGKKVTVFRLATNSRKSGKDETIWWRVTIWGEHFDKMIPHLKKGSPIVVFGEMAKPEIFTDKEGNPQIAMAITASHISFSPFGRGDRGSAATSSAPSSSYEKSNENEEYAFKGVDSSIADDEVPF